MFLKYTVKNVNNDRNIISVIFFLRIIWKYCLFWFYSAYFRPFLFPSGIFTGVSGEARLFWGTRDSTIKLIDSVFHFSAQFSSTRCQIWIFSKSDNSGAMMNVSKRAPGGISAYTCFGWELPKLSQFQVDKGNRVRRVLCLQQQTTRSEFVFICSMVVVGSQMLTGAWY